MPTRAEWDLRLPVPQREQTDDVGAGAILTALSKAGREQIIDMIAPLRPPLARGELMVCKRALSPLLSEGLVKNAIAA